MYKICRAIAKILFRIFYRVRINGQISLDNNVGYLICGNHIHALDPVFIACFTKRPISFMGKKELFNKPCIGWFLRKIKGFPVDRSHPDVAAVKTAIQLLQQNNVVGIFPEGTRSTTGEMGEFKRGAVLIAGRANVPIVPVKIEGTYRLFSKMVLKIGEPIVVTKENQKDVVNSLQDVIKEL